MNSKNNEVRRMSGIALMAAVIVVLANTPLGMIQLPVIKATTVHIPVILGAVIFGPAAGALLGAVFGICSLISNTVAPTLLSFAFSPFLSTTGIIGAIKALWISLGCRILMGFLSGMLWVPLRSLSHNRTLPLALEGFIMSSVHTLVVMGSIYILLAGEYAAAKNVAYEAVWGLIMGTILASGIPEAVAAAVIVCLVGRVLLKVAKQNFD